VNRPIECRQTRSANKHRCARPPILPAAPQAWIGTLRQDEVKLTQLARHLIDRDVIDVGQRDAGLGETV
jgi:hypothetical protein